MEVIEFDRLSDAYAAQLVGDEPDPFEMDRTPPVTWRPKDRHVGLRTADGRLVASAGMVVSEIEGTGQAAVPVVGIGGVIVAAPFRGRGLGNRVIAEALSRAAAFGPPLAMLFCHRDRAGLYARHAFAEIPPPVFVDQPGGRLEMPLVAMWRALRDGTELPPAPVSVRGLPF